MTFEFHIRLHLCSIFANVTRIWWNQRHYHNFQNDTFFFFFNVPHCWQVIIPILWRMNIPLHETRIPYSFHLRTDLIEISRSEDETVNIFQLRYRCQKNVTLHELSGAQTSAKKSIAHASVFHLLFGILWLLAGWECADPAPKISIYIHNKTGKEIEIHKLKLINSRIFLYYLHVFIAFKNCFLFMVFSLCF